MIVATAINQLGGGCVITQRSGAGRPDGIIWAVQRDGHYNDRPS